VEFLNDKDILYVAVDGNYPLYQLIQFYAGKNFSNLAILDDYETGKVLGEGGFGKVILGTEKLTKKKVAIKYIDVTEQCKYLPS
jgi:serine/threonine protein kinase